MANDAEFPVHRIRSQVAIARRVEKLLEAIHQSDSPVSDAVKAAIDNRGEQTEFDALAQLLDDASPDVRREAAYWIAHQARSSIAGGWDDWFLSESTATLLEHLEDENTRVRLHLLQAYKYLDFCDPVEVLPRLVMNLTKPEIEIRIAALQAIQTIGRDLASGVVDQISALLDDPDAEVREEVYQTLEWLGADARPALPLLLERILGGEENSDLRRRAVLALIAQDLEPEFLFDEMDQGQLDQLIQALREAGESGRALRIRLTEYSPAAEPGNSASKWLWLSKTEIAEKVGVSAKTIDRWLKAGRLTPHHVRSKGKKRRYKVYQVDPAHLAMLKKPSASPDTP